MNRVYLQASQYAKPSINQTKLTKELSKCLLESVRTKLSDVE